jgi:hypothetical protein
MKARVVSRLTVCVSILTALLLLGQTRSVQAMPCLNDLGSCYRSAAASGSFWMQWAAGLDCELGFVSCTREDLVGY